MSEIIKKIMEKLSIEVDDDIKLTSEKVIEMEDTYGAHKYYVHLALIYIKSLF